METLVRDLAVQLKQRFDSRVVDVRLYGSWARGEARPDSDVDVCVLLEGATKADKIEIFDRATELSLTSGLHFSMLVMTPEEFRRLQALEARLALDIEAEGISA